MAENGACARCCTDIGGIYQYTLGVFLVKNFNIIVKFGLIEDK